MSAFIVQDRTINNVVNFARFNSKNSPKGYMFNELMKVYNLEKEPEKLGGDLFKMNVEAVEARYGKGQAKGFRTLDYKYVLGFPASDIQTLKSLDCLLYECDEGNVSESTLFKIMEKVQGNLASHILHRSKEYENAKWD